MLPLRSMPLSDNPFEAVMLNVSLRGPGLPLSVTVTWKVQGVAPTVQVPLNVAELPAMVIDSMFMLAS